MDILFSDKVFELQAVSLHRPVEQEHREEPLSYRLVLMEMRPRTECPPSLSFILLPSNIQLYRRGLYKGGGVTARPYLTSEGGMLASQYEFATMFPTAAISCTCSGSHVSNVTLRTLLTCLL